MTDRRILLALLAAGFGLNFSSNALAQSPSHPLCNSDTSTNPAKSWQLEYDEDSNNSGDLAVRLVVKFANNDPGATNKQVKLDATLYRFDLVEEVQVTGEPPRLKYKRRNGEAGAVELKGSVVPAKGTATHWKKSSSTFVFSGTYFDNKNNLVIVTVQGKYHPGKKNKRTTTAARSDDIVTFSVSEKKMKGSALASVNLEMERIMEDPEKTADYQNLMSMLLALDTGLPCDDAPPADAAAEAPLDTPADPADFPYMPAEP